MTVIFPPGHKPNKEDIGKLVDNINVAKKVTKYTSLATGLIECMQDYSDPKVIAIAAVVFTAIQAYDSYIGRNGGSNDQNYMNCKIGGSER